MGREDEGGELVWGFPPFTQPGPPNAGLVGKIKEGSKEQKLYHMMKCPALVPHLGVPRVPLNVLHHGPFQAQLNLGFLGILGQQELLWESGAWGKSYSYSCGHRNSVPEESRVEVAVTEDDIGLQPTKLRWI